MHRKCTPNQFIVDGETAYLILTNRKGEEVARAIIDAEDLGRVLAAGRWSPIWNKAADCYYVFCMFARVSLHRFVMCADPNEYVDHREHDTLDCRKSQLRRCSHMGNMQNRKGAHRNSKSGVRGVYWCSSKRRWIVQVRANNKKHYIGAYLTLGDAKVAAVSARERLHGDFAA